MKTENLFLTEDGRVKILDFGLARTTVAPAAEKGEARPSPSKG
jgi:serine/threonine protein kinase